MLGLMHEVSNPPLHPAPEVSPALRWERVKKALGVTTQEEAARHMGMSLRTLQRLLDNPDSSRMRTARRVSTHTGISTDDLLFRSDLAEAA